MRRCILVLGCSSGFGAASCRAFATAGYDIFGVHLDRRATLSRAEAVAEAVRAEGRRCHFFNLNAASDEARAEVIGTIAQDLAEGGGRLEVLLHSLAFGTLRPLVPAEGRGLQARQLAMTMDVMAGTLVWWTRDLIAEGLLGAGGRVFAMTSSGSHTAAASYGAVAAAKAALEALVRQLAMELAPRDITVNAVMAGVTRTPALEKIPDHEDIVAKALIRNPHDRLTRPEDVASCLVELARPGTYWLNGNVLRVDGGEDVCS